MKSYIVNVGIDDNNIFNAFLEDYYIVGSGKTIDDSIADLELAVKQTLCANEYDKVPPFFGLEKTPKDIISTIILTTSIRV
jgi:hypothetical protein